MTVAFVCCIMLANRVDMRALSAVRTGSCRTDEKGVCPLRFACRIPLMIIVGLVPLLFSDDYRGFIMSKNTRTRTLIDMVILAVAVALNVVLSRFLSFSTWNMKFSLIFLTIAFAARRNGVIGGAVVGGLGDFIGAIMFPIGPYYPLFTLTAVLDGIVMGLFLKKGQGVRQVVPAVLINQLFGSLVLNSLWISLLYNSRVSDFIALRSLQTLIMIVIECTLLLLLGRSKQYSKLVAVGK